MFFLSWSIYHNYDFDPFLRGQTSRKACRFHRWYHHGWRGLRLEPHGAAVPVATTCRMCRTVPELVKTRKKPTILAVLLLSCRDAVKSVDFGSCRGGIWDLSEFCWVAAPRMLNLRSKTHSETICDSETTSQKQQFRNYFQRFRNYIYSDSETITIQKLWRFRNYRDSETITIQKLARFRNYHGSETITIQKLRFRNYGDSETITLQKLSRNLHDSETIMVYRNYHDSETQIKKTGFRHYFLRFTKLTRLRTSRFRSSKWYQNAHPHGASNGLGLSTRKRWYQNSRPHGTSNWRGLSTRIRLNQNWLGLSTRTRWYQTSHPHGTQIDLGRPQG